MHFKSQYEEATFLAIKESSLQNMILKKEYPWHLIFESFKAKNRFVDFYFPQIKLIIEVNGIQHYQPTAFHSSQEPNLLGSFENQRRRDKALANLCEIEDVNLIIVDYRTKNILNFLEKEIGELYGV